MRKLIFILIFIVIGINAHCQYNDSNKNWDQLLYNVTIKQKFSMKERTYFMKPVFGDSLKMMDGHEITLSGFFLPVDVTGGVYVVSYNPMKTCFFCTGSGQMTVIEVNAKKEFKRKFKRQKVDNYITVKGKLKLNDNDYDHLIYIINDAELVK